jgi:hypothetical protein
MCSILSFYIMATPPLAYHNAPLDLSTRSIRLLHLEKGYCSDIACTLSTFQICKCPPFIALSYAWASPHPIREVVLNGQQFSGSRGSMAYSPYFWRISAHWEGDAIIA